MSRKSERGLDMIVGIVGLRHMCREGHVELILEGGENNPIKLSSQEFERLTWACRLEAHEELIGCKLYISDDKVYLLQELEGDIETIGDCKKETVGEVLSLSSENSQCVWCIGTSEEGGPRVKVRTNHENMGNAQREMGCIFPWSVNGVPAIYTKGHAYLMQVINRK